MSYPLKVNSLWKRGSDSDMRMVEAVDPREVEPLFGPGTTPVSWGTEAQCNVNGDDAGRESCPVSADNLFP